MWVASPRRQDRSHAEETLWVGMGDSPSEESLSLDKLVNALLPSEDCSTWMRIERRPIYVSQSEKAPQGLFP